ncbi:MAG: fibronectin type III domain-containing protein [Bacteroidota bacterium]|nr:fibronectin type III domain-containing protein [Bacteroidota bacterium]
MIQKISIGFRKYTDANFEKKAQSILICMTGNPAFSSPIPTLEELQIAIDAYTAALTASEERSKQSVVNKNQSRKALEEVLRQLGLFVMYVANGDAAILASSGYDLTKQPEPQHLVNPGLVMMKDGITAGTLVVSVKKPKGSKSFVHELTADPIAPDSTWLSVPGSRASFTFQNLVPGKKYWARVAAIGSNNQMAYSDLNSRFAQ